MDTLSTFMCVALCVSFALADEMYSTKFDNIDYEEILKSERLLKNYVYCLLDKAGCTAEGKELKMILPDALETDCSKCSGAQKKGAKRVIQHLINNTPDYWTELMMKYDPDGAFKEKYEGEWLNEERR